MIIENRQARWSAGRKADRLVKKRDRKCRLQTEQQSGNANLKTGKGYHMQAEKQAG